MGVGSPMRRQLTNSFNAAQVQLLIPENMRKIRRADLKMSRDALGEGGFAKVVQAEIVATGTKVAVKIMNKASVSRSSFTNLQNEIDICATLSHPCIINTLGIFEDDESIYIVMDLAEGGELFKYTKKFGLEDMPIVAPSFIGEVILGLEYLHHQGIIHRDIKPENLLLTAEYHVKIADFGTVCRAGDDANNRFTGTAQYVSPEVVNSGRAHPASDMWAVGCVLYQLFVGRPPFVGESQYLIMQAIKERRFDFPPYFPADARDLVNRMLEMDPDRRIGSSAAAGGFDEIKRHPFFAKVDWNTILTKSNITHLNVNFNKQYGHVLMPGESIVYASRVQKERYKAFSVKERILILTDLPRLFYLKPGQLTVKGQVPWTSSMCAEVDSENKFHVHTGEKSLDRVYHFVDTENRAGLWVGKINDMVKRH